MIQAIWSRLALIWALISGRYAPTESIERLIFMSDLAKTVAAIAALNISADRLITKSQADDATIAADKATLANVDDTVSNEIAAVGAKIDAIAPVPVAVEPTPAA
jgi:hypothetical protein